LSAFASCLSFLSDIKKAPAGVRTTGKGKSRQHKKLTALL
jgi:hypothetical protein